MARIRSHHPGQWTDEDFVEMSFPARLLALAIRNEADDYGCFEWKPKRLKMRLFPADDVEIEELLSELEANNQVQSYEFDSKKYGAIRNFCKYQKPKKPSSFCPLPESLWGYVRTDGEGLPKPSGNSPTGSEMDAVEQGEIPEPVPDQFGTSSENAFQKGGREEGRKVKDIRSKSTSCDSQIDEQFETFWKIYPSRSPHANPKKTAKTKFTKAIHAGANPDEIISAAEAYAEHVDDDGTEPQFVAQAVTWLNQERYQDGNQDDGMTDEERAALERHEQAHGPVEQGAAA